MARQADGSVQMERATPQGLSIRKRFFFPPTNEKKDNYVSEMQIDFRNDGQQPYSTPGYFIALGSTRPTHPNDMPIYTRLVWCVDGEPKGIDVSWFEGSGGFLGFGQHAARPFYQEKVASADWAAMSNQFFTTILTPLNAKVGEVWGKRFEVKRGDGTDRRRDGRRDGTSWFRTSTRDRRTLCASSFTPAQNFTAAWRPSSTTKPRS